MIPDDLRNAALFAELDEAQLDYLSEIVSPLELAAGETLFSQGDAADAFFLVVSGGVKIFKTLRDGRTATLRHVTPGQSFAESVLFVDNYPSSTEAMADSLLLRIPTAEFRDLVTSHPELGLRVLSTMARLLVLLNQRVEELLLPVPARLARYLLELCSERHGPGACEIVMRESLVCYLPTSKRELASRLGTVPETLSRALNQLVRSKLISLDGARFEILDLRGLERLAQLLE